MARPPRLMPDPALRRSWHRRLMSGAALETGAAAAITQATQATDHQRIVGQGVGGVDQDMKELVVTGG